jgi:RimJ/RimL family protein N-acetyltransferase
VAGGVVPRRRGRLERRPAEPVRVAALVTADAPRYRELMLEAYVQAPDAFTSTVEERMAEPLAWWRNRIARGDGLAEAFGAFDGPGLVGSVALEYSAKPKTRHAALLIGMYVQARWRGHGVGLRLLEAALAAAQRRPEVEVLRLTVTEGNESAIRLYRSVGFTPWGVEPQSIRTPSGFKRKIYMSMPLRAARPGEESLQAPARQTS